MAQESHADLPLRKPGDLIRFKFRRAGIPFPTTQRIVRCACEFLIAHAKPFEVCFFKPFQVKQRIVRAAHRANQLVEFELDGVAIAILGILNQEYHQECDDRRAGVYDQLPGIAELKYRPCDAPDHDDRSGDDERRRMARGSRRPLCEAGKRR